MSVELDHIFVWTGAGAPEAERLASVGLTEGPPNTHPGQGTACRRFFFRNAYIELLWICDAAEAKSAMVSPLRLWERWSGRSGAACPSCKKDPTAGWSPYPDDIAEEARKVAEEMHLRISIRDWGVQEATLFFLEDIMLEERHHLSIRLGGSPQR